MSSYNNNLVMNLLVIISRISNLSIDECSRFAISNWIKSLLYYTHRRNNELIPNSTDFPQVEASTKSAGDKKYEGAIVLEPVQGVHFDVKVMDFASLYPSIIKNHNISYETVNCSHAECEDNKVPYTQHWICKKRMGIVSSLIGSLKELRVGHFKKLSKQATDENKKQQY
ncbi:MAG: DNA mismatch repair protein MutH, partial [Thaumarchaeota archaeon]|nr:DNA mismatch repair protein MutH [Nitrososphaerota archaeon]